VRYVSGLDDFRQVARVAAAQGLCVVNAAYTYDTDLIEKLPRLFPDAQVEPFSAAELPQSFDELALDEREAVFPLLKVAELALQPFRCDVAVKKFRPKEVPTLYSSDTEGSFRRDVERAREESDDLYGSMMDSVLGSAPGSERPLLTFNFLNPVVRKLAGVTDRNLMKLSVEMLYVQALLLGHRPLSAKEMALLNQGLLGLIAARLDGGGEDPGQGGVH
jgi:molecular chaperone HtpG